MHPNSHFTLLMYINVGFRKIRSLYFVIRPIMITYIGMASCVIISITYTLIAVRF